MILEYKKTAQQSRFFIFSHYLTIKEVFVIL